MDTIPSGFRGSSSSYVCLFLISHIFLPGCKGQNRAGIMERKRCLYARLLLLFPPLGAEIIQFFLKSLLTPQPGFPGRQKYFQAKSQSIIDDSQLQPGFLRREENHSVHLVLIAMTVKADGGQNGRQKPAFLLRLSRPHKNRQIRVSASFRGKSFPHQRLVPIFDERNSCPRRKGASFRFPFSESSHDKLPPSGCLCVIRIFLSAFSASVPAMFSGSNNASFSDWLQNGCRFLHLTFLSQIPPPTVHFPLCSTPFPAGY